MRNFVRYFSHQCGLLDCGVLLNQLPDLELVRELVVAHLLERGLRARELDALDALELRRLGGLALVSQVLQYR